MLGRSLGFGAGEVICDAGRGSSSFARIAFNL
jgi:hypothetical protein